MSIFASLLLPENLHYAWVKAKSQYRLADSFVDHAELAEFELDLEQRLKAIRSQFERGRYRLKKLRPLPRPKKIHEGQAVSRQYYHVAVDDQVAWIAITNALGPELDRRMPPWSYGNRLYRPAWYEQHEDRRSTLEIGPYRHASGRLYRKFQHSWPLFRRHVALAARTMARSQPIPSDELDESDRMAVASAEKERLPYLWADFWSESGTSAERRDLYHAAIDLRQFYPSLNTSAVVDGLMLAARAEPDHRLRPLLTEMLRFKLDRTEVPQEYFADVEPRFDQSNVKGIPTGLFVAGFLANAAMLPIDALVDERINAQKTVAHFRFVDDHTILAYRFDDLCEWIAWYEKLLKQHATGASVNSEKYDPPSLSAWMSVRDKHLLKPTTNSTKKKEIAASDTKIDGLNPTRLLTKTLAQVSALAAANADVHDDDDLQERLKQLEWLLLADIPEREIRPDTRAAFAAGQIAALAPVLVQEADGLVDAERKRASLALQAPRAPRATDEEVAAHSAELAKQESLVRSLIGKHDETEERHLRHCFSLLLQAFREHPGKARLFYKMHEYCRVTGYPGLSEITEWIAEMRSKGHGVWANYYSGLSLQILARSTLVATRSILMNDVLRSTKQAALAYLGDLARRADALLINRPNEAWFHKVGRQELAIAAFAGAESIDGLLADGSLSARLKMLSQKCLDITAEDSSASWFAKTGRRLGAWVHLIEQILSVDDRPSPIWQKLTPNVGANDAIDRLALRRYPELLPDDAWSQILKSASRVPESDSGWIYDVIVGNPNRIADARASKKLAVARAARSLQPPTKRHLSLAAWTQRVSSECSPFDPRRGEWTALEIVRQLVVPAADIGVDESILDRLHPNNVFVPISWIEQFLSDGKQAGVSWEVWRSFVGDTEKNGKAELRSEPSATVDYRFFDDSGGVQLNDWDRRLGGVGRLLLGLLRHHFGAPAGWNFRGNEHVIPIPRTRWLQRMSISSPTLLIIEGCLSSRSIESRTIRRAPRLFGWLNLVENDAEFDPPLLLSPNELLEALERAQNVLKENQLAVAGNQPRQVIPFRLSDFIADSDGQEGDHDQPDA